jgi:ubiquinone/menaquinone biosynthesis C-methylase UbiE
MKLPLLRSSNMSFVNPEKIVSSLDLTPGAQVADFGAGSGHWAVALSKLIGSSGKVYAVDVKKESLAAIRSHAKLLNINTIETIWADLETPRSTTLKDQSIDLVLISNVLFQVEKKEALLQEAWRIIKSGGKLAIVEWDETESLQALPTLQRVPRQEIERMLQTIGFQFGKEFAAGSHHYGLLFRKSL